MRQLNQLKVLNVCFVVCIFTCVELHIWLVVYIIYLRLCVMCVASPSLGLV